jgi:hypothetical protein
MTEKKKPEPALAAEPAPAPLVIVEPCELAGGVPGVRVAIGESEVTLAAAEAEQIAAAIIAEAMKPAPHMKAKADSSEPLLQLFAFAHLPPHLQEISAPFGALAVKLALTLPRNPERTTALRKLREAKDCAITAKLWKEPK